jgi:hypothetical protein
MLERYLDNLTSYAESVCGTFPDSMPIAAEPQLSEISESEATPARSARPFPDPESDEAEVLSIKYSSKNERTLGEELSAEDGYESEEWQGPSEEEHRVKSIRHPDRCASPGGAIGKGLQRYNGDRFDTPYNDIEYRQPEDDAQLTSRRQWDTNQTVLDWVTRTQVSREDTGLTTAATAKWKAVREVKLFKGNLVLDCPVPTRILYGVPHGTPPIRDEFTHVRYSALTCHPSEFSDSKFVLRPSLFAKPRSTEILIVISISENDLNSPAKQAAFARTLRSAIQIVRPEI